MAMFKEEINIPCPTFGCGGRVRVLAGRSNLADGTIIYIAEPNYKNNCDKCGEAATTKSCVILVD